MIELMIVVLIIGVLLAIALPVFLGAQRRANDGAVKTDVRNTFLAERVYFADGELGWSGEELRYVALGVTLAAALLMVSQIRYWSFKGSGEGGPRADRVPFAVLLVVPVAIAVLVIDLPRVLLAVGVLYALSGPLMALWLRARRPAAKA